MDPTYPLVPVVSFITAFLMLLTMLTGMRQTWNAGVLMLCTWLFIGSLIQGFGTIIWSDDADNIAPVWCDISSHLGLAVGVGIPACSLVITRRLCNIVCMRTINGRKRERYIQYFLVGFPIIVAGPFYHIVQASRFVVTGELGCSAAVIASRSTTMLMDVWPVVLPLLSAMIYCPRIIWTFYRQRRDVDAFLHGNGSIDHTRYFRILAVGCLDTVFTLPTGILLIVPGVAHDVNAGHGGYSFYPGWYFADHSDHPWAPQSISPAAWRSDFWVRFGMIFGEWVNLVLSILIFVLFGLTGEARAFYRRWFWAAVGLFRSKPPVHEDMPDMKFNSPPRHRVRSVGLSMPESSVMDEADFALSVHFTPPRDQSDSEGEVVGIIAREDHSRVEQDSVDAPGTQQARDADEAERDVDKEKLGV